MNKSSRDSRRLTSTDARIFKLATAIIEAIGPRCRVCHRPLTASESVRLGAGRTCRAKATGTNVEGGAR